MALFLREVFAKFAFSSTLKRLPSQLHFCYTFQKTLLNIANFGPADSIFDWFESCLLHSLLFEWKFLSDIDLYHMGFYARVSLVGTKKSAIVFYFCLKFRVSSYLLQFEYSFLECLIGVAI